MKFTMKFTMRFIDDDAWDDEATPCSTFLPSGVLVCYYQIYYVHVSRFTKTKFNINKFTSKFTMREFSIKCAMNDAWEGEAMPCITVLPSGVLVKSLTIKCTTCTYQNLLRKLL